MPAGDPCRSWSRAVGRQLWSSQESAASFDLVQSSFLRFGFLFFCLRQKNGVVVEKQDRYTLRTWTGAPLGFG